MKALLIITCALVMVGCSSTPKVAKTIPAGVGYTYGQIPQQRELEYSGREYKKHLRDLQGMGMTHEKNLSAKEYVVKEAIASEQLRRMAETNGVVVPTASAPQSQSAPASAVPTVQQQNYGPGPSDPNFWAKQPQKVAYTPQTGPLPPSTMVVEQRPRWPVPPAYVYVGSPYQGSRYHSYYGGGYRYPTYYSSSYTHWRGSAGFSARFGGHCKVRHSHSHRCR